MPSVVAKQRVMVRAEVTRRAHAGSRSVEHAAQRHTIDIARMHPEADNPPGELIHDDQHPVGPEENGFTAKEIDAPQAVFGVPKEGQPGGTTIARCWAIMLGQDAPHDVLVNVHTEGLGDDQRNPRAAESGIALLELDDRSDELWRWTFGTGLALAAR